MTRNRYITSTEAGTMLGVTAKTVFRWVDAGHLDGFRTPTGRLRVNRAQVLACIKPLPKRGA